MACYENALPQGSPCSPIISNLVGNILDMRLLALARDAHCTYTRYADDLTFSTNEVLFPREIAVNVSGSKWEVGGKLGKEIERTGFKLNDAKTRMSLRRSRQTVTGLVVNSKPNINQDYYRNVRAMCNSVFQTGSYHRPDVAEICVVEDLNQLQGMLSYIYFVKFRRDRKPEVNKLAKAAGEFSPPNAPLMLYRKFLNYKHFAAPNKPLIVTEGFTDITYLECAIRSLATSFPLLAKVDGGVVTRLINFLRPSKMTRDVLNLGHGTAGQTSLISNYSKMLADFKHKPMGHPVIVLVDNDSGSKGLFKVAKIKAHKEISLVSSDPFYYLGGNLYLVKIPEGPSGQLREIEDLFDTAVLETIVDGKSFDLKEDADTINTYGKKEFADKVVRSNWPKIDFKNFIELLSRLEECIKHYETTKCLDPNISTASLSSSDAL
ncbi:MAG: retron Ec67 family RNA-directed DNA polymerase/endonuclease [Parvibaculaceae bacterium]|nr:retron Ec67 family RNA-directed DNA polymerase/endonuclease [Parvibaculaceae bacterium]